MNENEYYSESELRQELGERLSDRVREEFDVNVSSEKTQDEIYRTVDMSIMDNLESTVVDGEKVFKAEEGVSVEDFAQKTVDNFDGIKDTAILENAGYYDLSKEEIAEFKEKLDEMKNSYVESEMAPEKEKLVESFGEDYKNLEVYGLIENPEHGGLNDRSQVGIELGELVEKFQDEVIEPKYQEVVDSFDVSEKGIAFTNSSGETETFSDIKDALGAAENEFDKVREYGSSEKYESVESLYSSKSEYSSLEESVVVNNEIKDSSVLDNLSKSEHEEVRAAVGANENASEKTLEKLSEDKSEMVVEAVAGNKAASFETLEKLGENDNSKISETAKETIEAKADEQLKDLDKEKESKTVSDAIDIMKDGKFDNDSNSDKQGQHSSDKSGQKA